MVKGADSGRVCSASWWVRWLPAVNAVGLLLAAVWFRCQSLGSLPGVNGDEAWYGVQALEILSRGQFHVQTPTGNPPNWLFLGPVTLLHVVFCPSIGLLRSVAVAGGLAALAINWWFCRWVFDRRTAAISTVILAVVPINVAYSRFAWDASQSVAATLPVLYLSLAAVRFPARRVRYVTLAVGAQIVAALVHPTNVFAGAAIAAAAATWLRWRDLKQIGRRVAASRRLTAGIALAAIVLAVLIGLWIQTSGPSRFTRRLGDVRELVRPRTAPHFSITYPRLLTGGTVFRYIAGSRSWFEWPYGGDAQRWGIDVLLFWTAVAVALWLLWRSWQGKRRMADRVLAGAWALGLVAFLLLAGPRALAPGWERFAVCLVGPTIVLLGRGAALCFEASSGKWRLVLAAASLSGWLALADFHAHYFAFIQTTGGRSHDTFRTASVDPKWAALDYILDHRSRQPPAGNGAPTWILASDWFIYWPLRYWGTAEEDVRVITSEQAGSSEPLKLALQQGRVWYVEFAGSRRLQRVEAGLSGRTVRRRHFWDYGGRPVLCVLQPVGDPE